MNLYLRNVRTVHAVLSVHTVHTVRYLHTVLRTGIPTSLKLSDGKYQRIVAKETIAI